MRVIDCDISGILSLMDIMKTVNPRRTVTPNEIFSPESDGNRNTSTVRVLIIMQGTTMLYLVVAKQYQEIECSYKRTNARPTAHFWHF